MSRPFAAAIFDLDGTLIDTESQLITTAIQILKQRGHTVTRPFLATLVGVDAFEAHRRLCAHVGAEIDRDAYDADWRTHMLTAFRAGIPLMPGVAELLSHLATRAIPRAVATNSQTQSANRKLAAAGLTAHFAPAHVVGYDAVPRPKPHPDVFLAAAHSLGVAPTDCVAFEDSETGVAAALAAGMTVVQIPDMAPARTQNAHHIAASILDGARACGLI
ncbi:fructose-1-phosphate phosphatase YqaB [mine drainage metagenome]|uniref:Fructose-1-phosphate phosphatase YqaB n=1 Tax=mine drainage metagenome TaxID=410659 RepID=A0A1J5PSB9_9ZZZZ